MGMKTDRDRSRNILNVNQEEYILKVSGIIVKKHSTESLLQNLENIVPKVLK